MFSCYIPNPTGLTRLDNQPAVVPTDALWVDLLEPTLEEEKRAEKAKSEDKKASQQRGFMKNIRGLFRKRGDR